MQHDHFFGDTGSEPKVFLPLKYILYIDSIFLIKLQNIIILLTKKDISPSQIHTKLNR